MLQRWAYRDYKHLPSRPALLCSKVEVEPTGDRLDLDVVVDDVHRNVERRSTVVVLATEVNKAVLKTEADVAGQLVLEPGSSGPSVSPRVEGKTVRPYGVPTRHIDACAGPATLGVYEPLAGCDTQTGSYGGNRIDVDQPVLEVLLVFPLSPSPSFSLTSFRAGRAGIDPFLQTRNKFVVR